MPWCVSNPPSPGKIFPKDPASRDRPNGFYALNAGGILPLRGENQCSSPTGSLLVHMPACAEPILDHPVDPLNRPGIETEGQQLPGALNLDGQGIKTLFQTLPVAVNIGFELLALIAHGSPLGSGGTNLCHRRWRGGGDDALQCELRRITAIILLRYQPLFLRGALSLLQLD